jgi:poly-beta-1,6-N-acetyl-D-glucosamine synthase
MTPTRLLIVTPVYNEAEHFDRVARGVAAQTRTPDRWIILDDGSDDGTLEVAQAWAERLPYATAISLKTRASRADGLALAREARAFNEGIRIAHWHEFTHIGKLDGDIELPPHWFETLLREFRTDPKLGIAGGRLAERTPLGDRLIPIPATHVHGAVKLYSRQCLEAVGGIPERLGWDTIDETYARMLGFSTNSPRSLTANHLRPWASGRGRLRGLARNGDAAWILQQPAPWAALRALKLGRISPYGLTGLAFAWGYLRSAIRRAPRVEDPEFRRFVRADLQRRVMATVKTPQDRRPDPAQMAAQHEQLSAVQ